jgi:hypothetical protein
MELNGNMKSSILKELLKIKSKMVFENSLNIFSNSDYIHEPEMIENDFLGKQLIKIKSENKELTESQDLFMNIENLLNNQEKERVRLRKEELKLIKKVKQEEEIKIKLVKLEFEKRMKELKEEQEKRRLNDIQLEKELELEKKEDEENRIRLNLVSEKRISENLTQKRISENLTQKRISEKNITIETETVKIVENFETNPKIEKNSNKNNVYLTKIENWENKKNFLENEKSILKNGYKKVKYQKELKIDIDLISFTNRKGVLKYFGPIDKKKGFY